MKRQARGRTLTLISAGALLFLGLLDFSFNIQNGIYTLSPVDGLSAAFIQIWCLGSGAIMARTCRVDDFSPAPGLPDQHFPPAP